MFLGLPDPHHKYGPGSGSFHHQAKNCEKNLDFYCFVGFLMNFTSVPDPHPDPLDRGPDPTPEDPDRTKNVSDPQHGR
jgi:hypothetical protein